MKAIIIFSIFCRLIAIVAILAFVFALVTTTGKLACLWLLFLLFAVELIPAYNYFKDREDNK